MTSGWWSTCGYNWELLQLLMEEKSFLWSLGWMVEYYGSTCRCNSFIWSYFSLLQIFGVVRKLYVLSFIWHGSISLSRHFLSELLSFTFNCLCTDKNLKTFCSSRNREQFFCPKEKGIKCSNNIFYSSIF